MNIIIPSSKRGIITPRCNPLNILNRKWRDLTLPGPSFSIAGRVKADIYAAAPNGNLGQLLQVGGWGGNMILNSGLDHIAAYAFANNFIYGHLSTDSSAPSETDTAMSGWVKQTSTYGSGDGNWA
ncbi:MAG: hypothetical protein WC378_19890, partial [Opitutaceae bacterium]